MKAMVDFLARLPKAAILGLSILAVLLLGIIDHYIFYQISFSIFYLMPVYFAAWFGNRNQSFFISLLSAATWLWADLTAGHEYANAAIPVWNSVMRLGFFLAGAISLTSIKELLERERRLARIDGLTGALNSRAFKESAALELDRSTRFGRPFTLAYIDVDNFKQVNDTMGHSQGDALLQAIAQTLREKTRTIDIVARLGGDEFAVLFTETGEENARTALAKVQKELLAAVQSHQWPVTFSIGAVSCTLSCKLDELIREADAQMYSVKASGKNRIAMKQHVPAVAAP